MPVVEELLTKPLLLNSDQLKPRQNSRGQSLKPTGDSDSTLQKEGNETSHKRSSGSKRERSNDIYKNSIEGARIGN